MTISNSLRDRIRLQAQNRCGYCLAHQRYVLGWLEIEHIIPTAHGGTDEEDNLWLACRLCNGYKGMQVVGFDAIIGEQVRLFNPRTNTWIEHFTWSQDGTRIIGLTACGRATVTALQLNNVLAVNVRRAWVGAGWHPPAE
jgi:hypothetical protein